MGVAGVVGGVAMAKRCSWLNPGAVLPSFVVCCVSGAGSSGSSGAADATTASSSATADLLDLGSAGAGSASAAVPVSVGVLPPAPPTVDTTGSGSGGSSRYEFPVLRVARASLRQSMACIRDYWFLVSVFTPCDCALLAFCFLGCVCTLVRQRLRTGGHVQAGCVGGDDADV